MDKTIYRLPEIKKIIAEQKYKFCSLFDMDGNTLCTYNSIKKGVPAPKSLQNKLEEIETRCKRLAPGVYVLVCKAVYGSNSIGDKFYLGVGQFDPTILNDAPTFRETKKTMAEPETKKEKMNLLSVEKAMDHLEEIANLKAENASLRAENKRLQDELDSIEEDQGMDEGESKNDLAAMFKDLIPTISPLADKYFELQEKKMGLEQAKFLHESGYIIPGAKRSTQTNGSQVKMQNKSHKEIPQPGAEGWEEFINYLLNLDENNFETVMQQLEANQPEIYEAACAEVYEEGEEGSNAV